MNPSTRVADTGGNRVTRRLHSRWTAVKRQWPLVALVTLVAVGAAGVVTWMQRPVYEAETMIRVDEKTTGGLAAGLRDLVPGGTTTLGGLGNTGVVEADMMVLSSRTIAESVADSLALHVRVTAPNRPRSEVLRAIAAPRDVQPGEFELVRNGNGSYRVSTLQGGGPTPDAVEIGQPFQLGSATLALLPELREAPPGRIRVEIVPFAQAVKELREQLQVVRPNTGAPMITVRYRAADPALAAEVPNSATTLFVAYKTTTGKSEARKRMVFLQEQLDTYEQQLQEAERDLKSYRESAEIINPAVQSEEQVRQLITLQAKRDAAETERASLQRLVARLSGNDPESAATISRQLAAYPSFFSNGAVQSTLQSLNTLETARADSVVLKSPSHPQIQTYDRRIQELQLQLYHLAQNYVRSLDDQVASMNSTLSRYGAVLATIPAREVEFMRRVREQKLMENVYTLLQTQMKESEVKAAGEPTNVQVIDSAAVPDEPLFPKPVLNLTLAGVLGLLLGLGVVLTRDALHPAVRSREDIAAVTAGAPILGQIPAPRLVPNGNGRARLRLAAPPAALPAALWLDPDGSASEAYDALSANLTLVRGERAPQLLVVTSARLGDGNDISTANLAVAVAQRGVRTLLVDAELRGGSLHQLFEARQAPGPTELLRGEAELTDAVQRLSFQEIGAELDFVGAGSPVAHATALLGSPRLDALLETLRERYQLVIFRAPPLDTVADAELLGRRTDSTVLVARYGFTEKEALQLAAERLTRLGIPLLGVVLGDARPAGAGSSHSRLTYA